MAQSPRLDSVLSFSRAHPDQPTHEEHRQDADAASDSGDDAGNSFEFAFVPPLAAAYSGGGGGDDIALADDLFAPGRILPAYPVFDRHLLLHASPSRAPPSPDTCCPWVPRSARDPAFPKSASTGEARRWRLRDLIGRSHSDGKEKFVFLQPAAAAPSKMSQGSKATTTAAAEDKQSNKPPQTQQRKQGKKKEAVTEMDMATAHKLFYGKPGAGAGGRKQQRQQASYLPYRPGIVGFFANVHALGRSHHHPH